MKPKIYYGINLHARIPCDFEVLDFAQDKLRREIFSLYVLKMQDLSLAARDDIWMIRA